MRKVILALTVVAALWVAPGAFAAWCGSGEAATDSPDVVTGRQVHAIVALPADAPDTFAANANLLADDVDFDGVVVAGPGLQPASRTSIRRTSPAAAVSTSRSCGFPTRPRGLGTGASAAFQVVEQQLFDSGLLESVQEVPRVLPGRARGRQHLRDRAGRSRTRDRRSPSSGWRAVPTCQPTRSRRTSCCTRSVPCRRRDPHCPADPAHPCDSPTRRPLPVHERRAALAEGARLQP